MRNPQWRRFTQQFNNNSKEVIHSSQGIKTQGRRVSKEIKTTRNQIMDWVTSLNTTREIAKNYGNKPSYQGQHQPVSNQATMQQPRIDFGMILPTKFGLEQFLEMIKALKCIEDKYLKPQYNRHEPSKEENPLNKENQQPNGSTQSTSQTSQHGKITQNTNWQCFSGTDGNVHGL